MRFIKNNYKKIGVAILIVLLTISAIVNIRLMSTDKAREVAKAGNYDRYEESLEGDDSQNGRGNRRFEEGGNNAYVAKMESGDEAYEDDAYEDDAGSEWIDSKNKIGEDAKANGIADENFDAEDTPGSDDAPVKLKAQESEEVGEREKLSKYIGEAWNHTGNRYVYILYQQPDYSREITVTVQVDYLSIFEEGVECNDEKFRDRLDTDGYILKPTKITCYEGENCWDAIARALIDNNIQYTCDAEPFKHGYEMDNKYGTCYLTCCDNMYTGVNAEGKSGPFGTSMSGWTYTVTNASGKTVYPGLGMNGVLIKDGDTLRLKYHNGLEAFDMDEYGEF